MDILGLAFGVGVGAVAGLSVGPFLFHRLKPTDYKFLSEDVDHDEKAAVPRHGMMVSSEMRDALPLMEPWLEDPQFERVHMINRLLATVWPTVTKAVLDMVLHGDVYNQVLYPQLKAQVFDKYKFVEDIVLGTTSLRTGEPNLEPIFSKKDFTIGTAPPRCGGFKVVPTSEDEVLLETDLVWGSNATLDVTAVLRFGALRLVVPLQLANITFKAHVRLEMRPLVDKIPCIGAVAISLLRLPTIDCKLVLAKGVDIMALPFVPQLLNLALKVVLEPVTIPFLNKPLVPGVGLITPNTMAFPLMPNFGLAPPPKGAIKVTVLRLDGIKGGNDLYCKLEVRRGRFKQTRVITGSNSPEFNEDFALIVDSFETDTLRVLVYNDDLGWNDTMLGTVEIPFAECVGYKVDPKDPSKEVPEWKTADFIRSTTPGGERKKLVLRAPQKGGALMRLGSLGGTALKGGLKGVKSAGSSTFSRIFSRSSTKSGLAPGAAGEPAPSPRPGAQLATAPSGALPSSASLAGSPSMPRAQAPGAEIGSIELKLEFVPFFQPQFDDEVREQAAAAAGGKKDPRMSMFPPPLGRSMAVSGSTGSLRGVLTVQLIRCIDLAPEGAKDLATYVRMLVSNDEHDEAQTSTTILNETSPRWGDKFDYVLIPAASSELHLEVFNKAGAFSNLVGSVFGKKKEDKDNSMGKLLINVKDVARNGRLKDTWALQDTDRGYVELSLQWQTCYVSNQ